MAVTNFYYFSMDVYAISTNFYNFLLPKNCKMMFSILFTHVILHKFTKNNKTEDSNIFLKELVQNLT
jgi:hypothetical protein